MYATLHTSDAASDKSNDDKILASVAQLAEQWIFAPRVEGSKPSRRTTI